MLVLGFSTLFFGGFVLDGDVVFTVFVLVVLSVLSFVLLPLLWKWVSGGLLVFAVGLVCEQCLVEYRGLERRVRRLERGD